MSDPVAITVAYPETQIATIVINVGPAGADGSGGGGDVQINGVSTTGGANFRDDTPAAAAGGANVIWQRSGTGPDSVSGYIPAATGAAPGAMPAASVTKLSGIATGADVTGANPPQAHAPTHQWDGSDPIALPTTLPSAPASGATLWANRITAGLPYRLAQRNTDDPSKIIQDAWQSRNIMIWTPNTGASALSVFGGPAPTIVGTLSHQNPSTGTYVNQYRFRCGTSATTAGTSAELRSSVNAVGELGYSFIILGLNFDQVTTNARGFMGMSLTSTALANVDPATFQSAIGFYWSGAGNLKFGSNDASGNMTQHADLGTDYPVNGTAPVYNLYAIRNITVTGLAYAVERVDTTVTLAGGSVVTSDIPTDAANMTFHMWANNSSDTGNVRFQSTRAIVDYGPTPRKA